ncbi:MAG TPA: VOC family protein [Gemmataceae bacterium]|nr:VOC family protein [Gemmataceae bacterium]
MQAYWGVPDVAAELGRLEALGARVQEPVKDVGGGIKVASVRDPFGNLFSIIENPHFKLGDVR